MENEVQNEDIFRGVGVEVQLKSQDDFLKVRETLTRIGIASKKERKLYQSCHILHKRGRYVILSFKELFKLDGKESNFNESDLARRNTIAKLLHDWSLVQIIDLESIKEPTVPISQIKIIPYKDRENWELIAKYQVGSKK
ncbi:MAG: translational repressor RegA [Alphaproteobacteria bacterium]|nr:translational repressor RegA [Alphaproteobacteria bacterium]